MSRIPLVFHARAEAEALFHEYIGTEHVLLALAAEGRPRTKRLMEAAGLTREKALGVVKELLPEGPLTTFMGGLTLTPHLKAAIESARMLAEKSGTEIEDTHMLCALLSFEPCAAHVVACRLCSVDRLRDAARADFDPPSAPA